MVRVGVAIDFAGTEIKNPGTVIARKFEQILGAGGGDFQRFERVLAVVVRARDAGGMNDEVVTLVRLKRLDNVVLPVAEPVAATGQRALFLCGDQTVEHGNRARLVQMLSIEAVEHRGEIMSQKAETARDQNPRAR